MSDALYAAWIFFKWVCFLVGFWTIAAILWATLTMAQEARQGVPDISEYYESLRQPDRPHASCCGEGDAYYADKTDYCRPGDGVDCVLVAIITDERPNIIVLPHRTIHRAPVPVGTRVPIPRHKIRRPPIVNPTDHSVVFLGAGRYVLCWEPNAKI